MSKIPAPIADKTASAASPISAGLQLTRLSSVINGLELGASKMRAKAAYLMTAVASGNYRVDASQVSRRIIVDCLVTTWRFSPVNTGSLTPSELRP
ncbi:MAG: hypothetical protein JO033_18855 [Acidobacteriaceae bacterium]|nr:hypothetical protein [Acidobacteriaceae bacterium]MBV9498154.1 hypothetical protein [Acidobacteriaceae bacterium]